MFPLFRPSTFVLKRSGSSVQFWRKLLSFLFCSKRENGEIHEINCSDKKFNPQLDAFVCVTHSDWNFMVSLIFMVNSLETAHIFFFFLLFVSVLIFLIHHHRSIRCVVFSSFSLNSWCYRCPPESLIYFIFEFN